MATYLVTYIGSDEGPRPTEYVDPVSVDLEADPMVIRVHGVGYDDEGKETQIDRDETFPKDEFDIVLLPEE